MLVAKTCDGCSTAPLTQYKNNKIYQEKQKKINLQIMAQMIEFILI